MADRKDDDGPRLQDSGLEEIDADDLIPGVLGGPSSAGASASQLRPEATRRISTPIDSPRTFAGTASVSSFFPRTAQLSQGSSDANSSSSPAGSGSSSSSGSKKLSVPADFFKPRSSLPSSSLASSATPSSSAAGPSRSSVLGSLGGSKPPAGATPASSSAATSASSNSSGRQLPSNLLPSAAASSKDAKSKPKQLSILQPRHIRHNPLLPSAAAGSRFASGGIPVVDGSNARMPSVMLSNQTIPKDASALPSIPRIKPEAQAQAPTSSSSAPSSRPSGTNGKSAATVSTSDIIDLTMSDDDEPKVISVRKTEPDIVLDTARTVVQDDQIVCIGMIRVGMTSVGGGLPWHLVSEDGSGRNWFDELYDSAHWPAMGNLPRGSAFWTEPGFRPVHIEIIHQPIKHVPTGRFVNDHWETREEISNIPQGIVKSVLSPAHQLSEEQRRNPAGAQHAVMTGPKIDEAFATMYERPAVLLANLQYSGQCGLEARFKVVPRLRAMGNFHQVEVNIFIPKTRVQSVIMTFRANGIHFERPGAYDPTDYPGHPPLITEHLSQYGVGPAVFQMPQGLGSSVSYTPVDAQEEARKQVDQVYSALRAGEDLPITEAGKLLKTRLFPHQKQALSFLLDREKDRSWEEESDNEDEDKKGGESLKGGNKGKSGRPSKGSARSKQLVLSDDDDVEIDEQKSNGKGKQKDDGKGKGKEKKEGRVVSLWKAEKNPYTGNITTWTNVVTNQKQKHRPQVCRGAILADDMGLGKTISIIALMTRTWDEADDFGTTPVTTLADIDLPEDEESDDDAHASSFGWGGVPRSRGRKKGKKEKKWREQERARITNLKKRSRATLIVCPLTVVSNWIEQINEHWVSKSKPKVYTYHGQNRNQNISFLANHDVIITTYSTLGYEFGRSSTWADEEEVDASLGDILGSAAAKKKGEDDDSDDDEEFVMYDQAGNMIGGGGGSSSKAGTKRKKRTQKEAFNPLQRIEFFRIVLDESHMIKETSTLQSKAVCNLSAQRRVSLTGTPIQNKLDDLYSQFKFLRLDPFHKKSVWTRYCMHNSRISLRTRKEAQTVDSIGLARIQTIMKAVALRRTKESKDAKGEPILKLPPKANRIVTLEFDEHERAKYETMRHRYKEDFEQMVASDSVGKNYASILVEINALRLTCDDASLVDVGKDLKRAKEGKKDLIAAIREDGLSTGRAAHLFKIFCDCDQGSCYDCERDLSGRLEAEEEDTDDEAPKRRNAKKAKTARKTNALNAEGETGVNPVVTKCQHLFCVDCFSRKLGTAWEQPKSDTKAPCPQCNESLTVTLDAIELDHEMIVEALTEEKSGRRSESDSEEDSEDEFDEWDLSSTDTEDEDEEEGARAWRPKTRQTRLRRILDDDEDEDEEEVEKGKGKNKAAAAGEGKGEDDKKEPKRKQQKSGMSSKVRALLEELEPFSRCNPYSQLYDRKAPRLEHWAPPPPADAPKVNGAEEKKPDVGAGESDAKEVGPSSTVAAVPAFEPVKVIQLPPLSELEGEEAAEARKAEPIKSVVFSQWTRMLDQIGKALDKKGIKYARLDGTMARTQRAKALDQFKHNRKCEVMLISLRAGGFGLNLVSACRAYLIDPYWNPAVENQGLDRIHRLGQRKPVVLTRFIMKKSIEENMLELQKRKMELAEQVGKRRGPQTAAERREERERDLRDLLK
ncbi:hypothetical protein OC844_000265 [Tilletia horrida]|nr:hypothetical protein OC844_000265 [Tilletia horrida]